MVLFALHILTVAIAQIYSLFHMKKYHMLNKLYYQEFGHYPLTVIFYENLGWRWFLFRNSDYYLMLKYDKKSYKKIDRRYSNHGITGRDADFLCSLPTESVSWICVEHRLTRIALFVCVTFYCVSLIYFLPGWIS